jgi:prophage regulatory protein
MHQRSGFLRLNAIIGPTGPIPVSRSSWWAGVASGRFPQPVKLGPRTTAWRAEDIANLIDSLSKIEVGNPAKNRPLVVRREEQDASRK